MEGEAGEFLDWELLHNSDNTGLVNSVGAALVEPSEKDGTPRNFEGIEGDSEGMIRSDHFSLENRERHAKTAVEGDVSEEGDSVQSDNPSWVDPGSETRYARRNSGEFWSDSSSDRSDERKVGEFDSKHELGLSETVKSQVGFEGIEEMKPGNENWGKLGPDESKFREVDVKHKDSSNFWSDSGGDALVSMEFGDNYENQRERLEISSDLDGGNGSIENKAGADAVVKSDTKSGCEGDRRRVVWWKVPLEVLKYCVFRASPVWSFSMAAAVMGLVILGRRLYKMKRKSQNLQLKVTIDDKVSFYIYLTIFYCFCGEFLSGLEIEMQMHLFDCSLCSISSLPSNVPIFN
jgi:hypothetical protein